MTRAFPTFFANAPASKLSHGRFRFSGVTHTMPTSVVFNISNISDAHRVPLSMSSADM